MPNKYGWRFWKDRPLYKITIDDLMAKLASEMSETKRAMKEEYQKTKEFILTINK